MAESQFFEGIRGFPNDFSTPATRHLTLACTEDRAGLLRDRARPLLPPPGGTPIVPYVEGSRILASLPLTSVWLGAQMACVYTIYRTVYLDNGYPFLLGDKTDGRCNRTTTEARSRHQGAIRPRQHSQQGEPERAPWPTQDLRGGLPGCDEGRTHARSGRGLSARPLSRLWTAITGRGRSSPLTSWASRYSR